MRKKIYTLIIAALLTKVTMAQLIPLPADLPKTHPRLMTTAAGKDNVQKQIKEEKWAQEVLKGIKSRIDKYVDQHVTDPTWMPSRLMMYWKSRATNVYIKGGVYSHADGTAPVPTVRFGSSRGQASVYSRPKLEDIIPYMDDTKGVYFHNTKKAGMPLEWGEQANASGIESINEQIMGLGKDAAFIYWLYGDEKYAKFAYAIFDTYMMGMYYRNEPVDLNNSHAQTLVGLSTFEVIQERILNELAYLYDFLYPYVSSKYKDKTDQYEATLKKWIDITIKNGVPQNNWNLHQAKFILKVAMVLEENKKYADGKGREYYIDYILNKTSARQWSLTKFMQYGYDENTGVWAESPGYSQGVTKDLTNFIRDYDNTFNQNLLPYTPIMVKAVEMLPQYLFPNGDITAFGDTHYGPIYTEAFSDMVRMAQKYKQKENETTFTRMYRLFDPKAAEGKSVTGNLAPQVASFFTSKPLKLDKQITSGKIQDFITQTFYAPNVSWFVQRSGYDDKKNGLMISQNASLGNHMHANGVSIELYGKGFVQGAESGIGSTYFQPDYKEYYSQFPAHNTVMVDGISAYPEMLSNHAFDLLSCYPKPMQKDGYYEDITFSDVYFLEPESRSDQNRFLSIVRTSGSTGYYIDIFRSKKQRQGDKFHDYFYHNLGQEMKVTDVNNQALMLKPSEEMAFAGGHLFALDYMWDKKSVTTDKDYKAEWKINMPDGDHVYMNLWMKGYPGREVFSIKSPPTKAFRKEGHGLPYDVEKAPFLTIAARQHGEAWNHPFVSVFEPSTEKEGKSIESISSFTPDHTSADFVGLIVKGKTGRTDYIFSSVKDEAVVYNSMSANATYAVVTEQNKDYTLFLGNGIELKGKGFTISAAEKTSAVLTCKNGVFYFSCEAPVSVINSKGKVFRFNQMAYQKIAITP
ncbi:Heparinase II/III-like protein [Pedobacter sp. ok626]|uniref:heparinase II/III family protein n=1 Tax=Pedobacter sp. ok626 TaxID=1761882 RepID=UPI00088C1F7B|nr:heparinase II/III family protein [Pedobacter sp. ok626]SDK64054.1 Heparinase II/III-like protein [Pedobacter sp. ok626]